MKVINSSRHNNRRQLTISQPLTRMLQTLIELQKTGMLKYLVQNGLMSPKVLLYLEVYLWVDARLQTGGQSLNVIVTQAEIAFNLSRRTIWRALHLMKNG